MLNNIQNVRVVTFQDKKVLDILLRDGIVETDSFNCSRYDISQLDDNDCVPFFTFLKLGSIYEYRCVNMVGIYYYWSSLMGYYRFNGRIFMELDIPIEYCKFKIEGMSGFRELKDIIDTKGTVECLIYKIDINWLVTSYIPEVLNCGYSSVVVNPTIYKPELYPLFVEPVLMSGDGYAEKDIYSKLPNRPRNNFYVGDLRYLVNRNVYREVFNKIMWNILPNLKGVDIFSMELNYRLDIEK